LCVECDPYNNSSPEEKEQLHVKYETHQPGKKEARDEKTKDVAESRTNGQNSIINVAVYNLQAVLPLPCGNVSTFYYKRKLAMYNLTVYNITENIAN
jgi:hypothetical protein